MYRYECVFVQLYFWYLFFIKKKLGGSHTKWNRKRSYVIFVVSIYSSSTELYLHIFCGGKGCDDSLTEVVLQLIQIE